MASPRKQAARALREALKGDDDEALLEAYENLHWAIADDTDDDESAELPKTLGVIGKAAAG